MSDRSGVSRGDRNRNARLARLRAVLPPGNAIAGIDLADRKQMVVVTDHESRVLARRTFRRRAWELGAALDWAAGRAPAAGFAGVTVAVEPTGHRWRVARQLRCYLPEPAQDRHSGRVNPAEPRVCDPCRRPVAAFHSRRDARTRGDLS